MTKPATKSDVFSMRVDPSWWAPLDKWRREQPDLPTRAEAIRKLVAKALSRR